LMHWQVLGCSDLAGIPPALELTGKSARANAPRRRIPPGTGLRQAAPAPVFPRR
jgi:hypothetical protein